MKLLHLLVPERYIKAIDKLVEKKYYPNRNELVRIAIRDLLKDELLLVGEAFQE